MIEPMLVMKDSTFYVHWDVSIISVKETNPGGGWPTRHFTDNMMALLGNQSGLVRAAWAWASSL